jgi:hypothetical protein
MSTGYAVPGRSDWYSTSIYILIAVPGTMLQKNYTIIQILNLCTTALHSTPIRGANKTCYINARVCPKFRASPSLKLGTERMPGVLARCRSFTDSRCTLAYKFIVHAFVHNKERRQTIRPSSYKLRKIFPNTNDQTA